MLFDGALKFVTLSFDQTTIIAGTVGDHGPVNQFAGLAL